MLETKEDVWNREIEVSDGANTLKEIFKSDYERTKELNRANIYISAEWMHITRLLKKRLRHEGTTQVGTIFIRRRLTVYGLQLLSEDNKIAIAKQQEQYDINLEIYNPIQYILIAQSRKLFPHDGIRSTIYLREETLGWIEDISDIFNLNMSSLIRVAWDYTIMKLTEMNFLHRGFNEHAKTDIALFREYCKSVIKR